MSAPRIPWPGGRRLHHVAQLQTGSPTKGTDCGPSSDVMALQAASGRFMRPSSSDYRDWIDALRDQMPHGPGWPATRLSDQRAAMVSQFMRGAFLQMGRRRPVTGVVRISHGDIVKLLAEGRSFVVGIDYGRLNDLMPRLSGSPSFRSGHAVMMQGLKRQRGVAWTRLGDPLHDGRVSSGRRVPKGFQTVRVRRYLRAAETFGGAGEGHAWVLWMAPSVDI